MGDVLSQGEFEEILRKVSDALKKIPEEFNRLVDNINSVLGWLPGFVWDKIKSALDTLANFIGKILTEIGKFVTQPGVPWTLWNHGTTWTKDVGGKASHWQDTMQVSQLKTDDEWTGSAAQAYKDILPLQQKALGMVKTTCDEIDDVLTKMAIAIGVAWLAIVTAIVSFVIELTAEAGAAATGVGAPPAAAGAALSAGKVWGIVAAALAVLEAFVASTLLPAIKDLQQRINSSDGFPQGSWPKLTTDISDSSMKDGDVDWEMSKA